MKFVATNATVTDDQEMQRTVCVLGGAFLLFSE